MPNWKVPYLLELEPVAELVCDVTAKLCLPACTVSCLLWPFVWLEIAPFDAPIWTMNDSLLAAKASDVEAIRMAIVVKTLIEIPCYPKRGQRPSLPSRNSLIED